MLDQVVNQNVGFLMKQLMYESCHEMRDLHDILQLHFDVIFHENDFIKVQPGLCRLGWKPRRQVFCDMSHIRLPYPNQ